MVHDHEPDDLYDSQNSSVIKGGHKMSEGQILFTFIQILCCVNNIELVAV